MDFLHNEFRYIDTHCHFFPPQIFEAIWNFFEQPDSDGNPQGWIIKYKDPIEILVEILESKNVVAYTTYNYAHKKGVAEFINDWTIKFVKGHKRAIPFGCVWPDDKDRLDYIGKIFYEFDFLGLKIQPLVQNFYPDDKRLYQIYDIIVDLGKWFTIHAGTAPYANEFVGYSHFKKFIEKYPNMNVIVAHLGAYEYQEFFKLLDIYENLYLDTSMVYIPGEIYHKWKRDLDYPTPEELLSYQDRLLYGSDYPNIPFEYETSTKGLFNLNLPRKFYENIFYNNAKKLFNIHTN